MTNKRRYTYYRSCGLSRRPQAKEIVTYIFHGQSRHIFTFFTMSNTEFPLCASSSMKERECCVRRKIVHDNTVVRQYLPILWPIDNSYWSMQFPQVMAAVARIDDGPKMYDEVLLLPPAVVVVVVVVGRMEDGILQRLLDVAAVVLEESLRRWSWRQWELTVEPLAELLVAAAAAAAFCETLA